VLRLAVTARPEDVVLLSALGKLVERGGRARIEEAIGYYRAARGRRRHLGLALSRALLLAGKTDEAEEVLRELALGGAHGQNPALPFFLGAVRTRQHRYAEAEAAYREAIRLRPGWGAAHSNLGAALNGQRKYAQGEAACREAVDLQPDCIEAYVNLGSALMNQGKHAQAEETGRKAVEIRPDFAEAHCNLGSALDRQGKQGEAEAAYRKAVGLRPDLAEAHNNLGTVWVRQQRYAEAEAAFRKAVELRPDLGEAHNNLGQALLGQKRYGEAEAAFRKAVDLAPDLAVAFCNLGMALLRQGRFDEAAEPLKKAAELPAATAPVREQARKVERQRQRFVTLRARLPAILEGKEKPANLAEQIEFATLCLLERRYAAAARFWRDAFAANPLLADFVPLGQRYAAACAAALAGCGQDADQSEEGRARWRRQALDWLGQDLAWWGKALDRGDAKAAAGARQMVRRWLSDVDLAGVRGREALARLPENERKQWERLWSDVDALLGRASRSE
jgi:Flp pilus assembly protein TadD